MPWDNNVVRKQLPRMVMVVVAEREEEVTIQADMYVMCTIYLYSRRARCA